MNSISVGKKIWLNLLVVMTMLVGAAGVLVHYLGLVNEKVHSEIRQYDDRILTTVRWRAASELAVSHIVAANMSSEEAMTAQLLAKQSEYSKQSVAFQQELEQQLRNEQAIHQMGVIVAARAEVSAANQKVAALRKSGAYAQAQDNLVTIGEAG